MNDHLVQRKLFGASLVFVLSALLGATNLAAAERDIEVPKWTAPVEPVTPVDPRAGELVESSYLIHAKEARNAYGVSGLGMAVAVLDTGCRLSHSDFAGRVAFWRNFTTDNGGDVNDVADGDGHGTHVAGIVCAGTLNIGIAPGANLVVLKVLNNMGTGTFQDVADALDLVIARQADFNITVVNMSLGDGMNYPTDSEDANGIRAKIQALLALGVAVCIAAGNDFFTHASAQGHGFPASVADCISVGAIYDNAGAPANFGGAVAFTVGEGRITPFSQRNHMTNDATSRTDVFAPGSALKSSGRANDTASSTMSGTSQATPVVAGLCLLMQELFLRQNGRMPTVDELETLLRSSPAMFDGDDEDDNVINTNQTYPSADALQLLSAIGGTPPTASCSLYGLEDPAPATLLEELLLSLFAIGGLTLLGGAFRYLSRSAI